MDISLELYAEKIQLAQAQIGDVFFFAQYDANESIFKPGDDKHLLCRILEETAAGKRKIIEIATGLVASRDISRNIMRVGASRVEGYKDTEPVSSNELRPGQCFCFTDFDLKDEEVVQEDFFIRTTSPVNQRGVEIYSWVNNQLTHVDSDLRVIPFQGKLVIELGTIR